MTTPSSKRPSAGGDRAPAQRALARWIRALTWRTVGIFAATLVASIAFVIVAAEVHNGEVDQLDVSLELAIHQLDSLAWDIPMKTATLIGTNVILCPAIVLVILLAIRRHERAAAMILFVDSIYVMVGNTFLKWIFQRDRPTLFDKIALPKSWSFPSGHSMSAMGIWGVIGAVLVFLYPRRKRVIVPLIALLILAIGVSRIYLGVHWPSDVLGGFLGGVPPLVVSVHLLHRRRSERVTMAACADHPPVNEPAS